MLIPTSTLPRALLLSFLLPAMTCTVVVSSACDGEEPGDDDDDDDDDDDTGEGEGEEGEGEGEGEGELPVTPDARSLCEIFTRGQLTFVGAIAQSVSQGFTARCSADDEGPDFPEPAEIAAAATQLCADDGFENNQVFARAIANGRVTFDIPNIEACSALDLEALEASGAVEIPAPCDPTTLFTGTQGEGQPCDGEWECTGSLRCEAADIHAQQLTCLAPASAGEPCVEGNISTDFGGLFENGQLAPRSCDENSECVDFECVALPGVGQPCDGDCAEGLTCDFGSDPSTCIPLGDVGDPCTFDDDCIDDLGCSNGECAEPIADGAACVAGDACEETCSTCRPTTPGGATFQCQNRGAQGAACESDDDCQHNFVCDVATNACVAGGTAGDECFTNDECAIGFVCSEVDGACIAQPGLGDACGADTSEDCEGNLVCAAGECHAGEVGNPCDDDDDCLGTDNVCIGATCAAPSNVGGPCSVDGECGDGLLCDGGECVATPGLGDACTSVGQCGDDAFCDDATTTCVAKKNAGAACAADDECGGVCVNGQCSAEGASCTTAKGVFPIVVLLSGLLPLTNRIRRRTTEPRGLSPG